MDAHHDALVRFPPPGPWHKNAVCIGVPYAEFFPERGGNGASITAIRRYCNRCPVRTDCLDYAMSCGPMLTGIWGGTTQNWRRKPANKAAWKAKRFQDAQNNGTGDVEGRSVA